MNEMAKTKEIKDFDLKSGVDGQIYECTSDYNVYAPDVSGWKLVE